MFALSDILFVIALLLFVRRIMAVKGKAGFVFLMVFLAAGTALALYESATLSVMLLGILVFNGLVSTYRSKENYAFFLLAVFFVMPIYNSVQLIAQSMLLGFLSGAYFFTKRVETRNVLVERRRDMVQIVIGLAFIVAFAATAAFYVTQLLVVAILVASLIGNFSLSNKKNAISRMLHSFERRGAVLGRGAMWLAAGTLFAIAFLPGKQVVAVLAAIFIGDAVATLVGTVYGSRLPYNRRKSVSGTAAYFLSTALVSFPFIGYAGILTALVAALAESLPKHVDDNFDTAVVLSVVVRVLGYAGLV